MLAGIGWYGGRRLARDLTLPALRRAWRQDGADQRRALSEGNPWTASQPRCEAEWRAELERRGDVAPVHDGDRARAAGADPAACAYAAQEAAGVLAAWSLA
jgi:hypothetical protein